MLPGMQGALGEFTLLGALGSALYNHWEVPTADQTQWLTLDGSNNAERIVDRVGQGYNLLQLGTPSWRPEYLATGGLNGRPAVRAQDASRRMVATMNIPDGHRVGVYVIQAIGAVSAEDIGFNCGKLATGSSYLFARNFSISGYRTFVRFTAGNQDVNPAASPSYSTAIQLRTIRPLASGALHDVDGVPILSALTGSSTVVGCDFAAIGNHSSGRAGFTFCFACAVDLSTDAAYRHSVVLAYINFKYGTSYSFA